MMMTIKPIINVAMLKAERSLLNERKMLMKPINVDLKMLNNTNRRIKIEIIRTKTATTMMKNLMNKDRKIDIEHPNQIWNRWQRINV